LGVDIVGIDAINSLFPDYFVITTSKYYEEIKMILVYKYKIPEEKILNLNEYRYYIGNDVFYR